MGYGLWYEDDCKLFGLFTPLTGHDAVMFVGMKFSS